MENSGRENDRSKIDWIGTGLLLFAVAALVALNLLKGGLFGGLELGALGFQALYPLAYACSALSMLAFAALLLLPRARRWLVAISVSLAALSALCSAVYAVGWWVAVPELMFWQDYAGIALQLAATGLTVTTLIQKSKSIWRLLAACGCIAGGTLLFLLPPLFEPAASVLTRALALASPAALLAIRGLFTEDSPEETPLP